MSNHPVSVIQNVIVMSGPAITRNCDHVLNALSVLHKEGF